MRWSKLKSSLDDLRAPALRGRVALNQARYRYTREEVGRIWITVDGREVASFDTSTYIRRRAELGDDLFESRRTETPGRAPDHATYLEAEWRAVQLWLDDAANDAIAAALGYAQVDHQKQRREVKRFKDRLLKRLSRYFRRLSEDA
jgi:hypothetical protein